MLPMLLLALTAAHADPPKIQEGFVLRPQFHTTKGDFEAGTAFALVLDDQLLMVTAFHLFGPPGGLPAQVPAADLPTYTTGVTVRDAWSGVVVGESSGPALLVVDAQPLGETAARDVAAFPMQKPDVIEAIAVAGVSENKVLRPGTLAESSPAAGEPIYVAAPLVTGGRPGVLAGTVLEVNADWVFFEYAATELDLTATSGAPVLDAEGRVIGIALGAGLFEGKLIGSASPVDALKERLATALTSGTEDQTSE